MVKINDAYVRKHVGREIWSQLSQETRETIKITMEKYRDNRWWESEDPLQIAMYQIFEDILIVDFDKYHQGLEKLVGRPVFTHEFGISREALREEARMGIRRLKKGIGTSDEYKQTAVRKSIEMLEEFCRRTGKGFLATNVDEDKPERNSAGIDTSGYDGWLKPE